MRRKGRRGVKNCRLGLKLNVVVGFFALTLHTDYAHGSPVFIYLISINICEILRYLHPLCLPRPCDSGAIIIAT